MVLKKIKLPDNSVVEVQDSRIPAPQSTDNGKVLGVTSAAGAMGWVEQSGGGDSGSKIYVGTCATAAATVVKVVTVETFPLDGNGKPLVGTTIAFKSSYTNSATAPTLNVNETGAASIWYNTAAVTTANTYTTLAGVYCFYVWDGTYWVWINFGKELNDNTLAYQVRLNSAARAVSDTTYRYRLLFSSADNTQWVPANSSSSTNATSARAVNTRPIDPLGPIVLFNSTGPLSAGGKPGVTVQFFQYHSITLGYSFNRTGAAWALSTSKPVYVVCKPSPDGSAIMDTTEPIVQDLPTTETGKIYIFLGLPTAATTFELFPTHPVYWYKDGAIRQWFPSNAYSAKESDENVSAYLSRAIGSNEAWTETLNTGTFTESGYIAGADGEIISESEYWDYYTIPLGTAKKVRFNGFAPCAAPSSGDSWVSGYAFYDSNDTCISSQNWTIDTSLPAHTEKEIIIDVPTNATTLRVTNAKGDAYYAYSKKRPFYCYLMEGKTISEMSVQAINTCTKIWAGTQAQYDLLTPDSDTLYLITGQ